MPSTTKGSICDPSVWFKNCWSALISEVELPLYTPLELREIDGVVGVVVV
jgi:hypothetical protein